MSWVTREFRCEMCQEVLERFLRRSEDEATQIVECEHCGGGAPRILSAPAVLNHTLPSGNGRFNHLREQAKLRKEAVAAKNSGDRESEKKARAEIKKVTPK